MARVKKENKTNLAIEWLEKIVPEDDNDNWRPCIDLG